MKSAVTRRVSFYLKPDHVKAEKIACDLLDALPAGERAKMQRSAMLAGIALMKQDSRLPGLLAELLSDETDMRAIMSVIDCITPAINLHAVSSPLPLTPKSAEGLDTLKGNARCTFPE